MDEGGREMEERVGHARKFDDPEDVPNPEVEGGKVERSQSQNRHEAQLD